MNVFARPNPFVILESQWCGVCRGMTQPLKRRSRQLRRHRDRSWASSLMWQPWCNVQIPTSQKIPKLWRNPTFRSGAECASVMQRHVARYSAGQEVPQFQFVDEVVDVPVVTERQVPTDQKSSEES